MICNHLKVLLKVYGFRSFISSCMVGYLDQKMLVPTDGYYYFLKIV